MLEIKARPIRQRHALRNALLIVATIWLAPQFAQAHFILVAPESWMSQNSFGLPEKLGPCGDEGGGTATGAVTAFHPGQTIAVTINEVITHPGHYRVALSVNDRSELPAEPVVTPSGGDPCASAAIQDPPVFPILADNMLPHTQAFAGPQTFMVTLPSDVTCSKCTLQVLEFMSSHGAPCFYHHCADISIQEEVPAVCGDGQLTGSEQCDDANTASGDGCDSLCRLECGPAAKPALTIGKLNTPPGDDTLRFQGTLTLPSPLSPTLNPLANGIRLLIEDNSGTVLDLKVPGGSGWSANGMGTRWAYRNGSATPPAGIYKVIIQDKSAVTPGLVRFAVRGKAQSAAIIPADLPVSARMILAASGHQCGDASFATCAFNASGNKLKCE